MLSVANHRERTKEFLMTAISATKAEVVIKRTPFFVVFSFSILSHFAASISISAYQKKTSNKKFCCVALSISIFVVLLSFFLVCYSIITYFIVASSNPEKHYKASEYSRIILSFFVSVFFVAIAVPCLSYIKHIITEKKAPEDELLLRMLGVSEPVGTAHQGKQKGRFYFWSVETRIFIKAKEVENATESENATVLENATELQNATMLENATELENATVLGNATKFESSCKVGLVRFFIYVMFIFVFMAATFQMFYYGLTELRFNVPPGGCDKEFDCFHSIKSVVFFGKDEIGERCYDTYNKSQEDTIVCIRLLTSSFGFSTALWKGIAIAYALYLFGTRIYNNSFEVCSFFCSFLSKWIENCRSCSNCRSCNNLITPTRLLAVFTGLPLAGLFGGFIFLAIESNNGNYFGSQFLPLVVFGTLFFLAGAALSFTLLFADYEDESSKDIQDNTVVPSEDPSQTRPNSSLQPSRDSQSNRDRRGNGLKVIHREVKQNDRSKKTAQQVNCPKYNTI